MDDADPLKGFSNLLDRPPGPVLSLLGTVLPGVRAVADQRAPYAAAWSAANRAALRADGPLWVALGDSMTQGIGASAPDRGWVGQAAALLAGHGLRYRVLNLSMTGARTEDVIDRQLPVLRGLPTPALVTALVGSNDMLSPTHRRLFAETYGELIDLLPDGTVLGALPPRGPALQASAAAAAAVAGRGFVEVAFDTDWHGMLASDHFHPNDLGHGAIAAAFAERIRATRSAAAA